MVDSDGETTRTNGGVGADGGLPRPIEIEVGPSASEGELTLYSVICDFLAGVVLPPPEESPPAAFLRRLKFSYYKASPCLREASRNSARDLLLWTRRGGSPRALFVIAVGTITLLALTGLMICMFFLFAATLNAIIISFLVSSAAAGGFLVVFLTCLTAVYIGALLFATFVISTTTISAIVVVLIATGWIGFIWIVWLAVKKSVDLTRQSVSITSTAISAYSTAWQARQNIWVLAEMATGSGVFKFLRPRLRPQPTDVAAAATWGVAATATALWLIQLRSFALKLAIQFPSDPRSLRSDLPTPVPLLLLRRRLRLEPETKMYMAYGWPQVIPLESTAAAATSSSPSFDRIVYLKVINRHLLVVSPTHLELWSSSQHKVRLGKYVRDADSVEREGENLQAIWSPDTKSIAVLTSASYLHIYKVHFSGKRLMIGGKQLPGLFLASVSLVITEKAPFREKNLVISNFVCDSKNMLLGLSDGHLQLVSWIGEFPSIFKICCQPAHSVVDASSAFLGNASVQESVQCCTRSSAIVQLELSLQLRLLVVLFSGCQIALCSVNKKGLKQTSFIKAERWLNTDDAMCASVASDQQILAVGCSRGVVELYDLAENATHLRTISLYDWGYSMEDTGPVTCISWTPDNCAFAVGWKFRGLTVWSASGCRLMCTIRQIGMSSASSPMVKPNQDLKFEPLIGGTSQVQWDEFGYKLYAIEERSSERILAFSFGKCCLNRGLSGTSYVRQIVYGEDRVLVVQPADTDELKIVHLNLPVSYISQNWPVLHVVASKDGMYLAVAGVHGLILYDLRNKKWRVFGDVTQEQKIECKGLLWLGKIIVVCNYIESSNTYELLFYPRYHLDQSSLLYRKQLLGKPMVMDVFQDYILVTYRPFDVHIFHVKISGELSPSSSPVLQLSTVRELSIMTAKSHPASMRFIPDSTAEKALEKNNSLDILSQQPSRCLILRTNGELSVLDLDDGHEQLLSNSVELFWVTCGQSEEKANLIEEVSWLDYGHRGMQVWYPSPGVDPFKREDFLQLDPELEFDREIYPLGLLPNIAVVVGVCQRMSFSACSEFPCFEPSPQAQTILHCLLRHLLQRDKSEEALHLACLSAEKPHFSHCLEWLLFTVFDAEISRQSANKNQFSASLTPSSNSLLEKTCNLIKNFPEYVEVVVSVARKTDGRHWADLFSSAGRSTELFEECFQRRWYRTAACYILVIAKLEGPAVSQYCALRLLQATLDESLYELAGELVRFLLRSGREYENATTESDKLSPRILGYFLFRSPYRRQSSDLKSTSFKDLSPHIASVKNILETHASHLMSGKELSKLVAFVKGTQFDLVEYLQRERQGSARLENFASGLQLIGQKLQMDTLQSRLDAEFLLAHMCSVKFKEWIVVLATLLRRAEVLVDLFRHDLRLWTAYSRTLQSHPSFHNYLDLLDVLEEQLASVSDQDIQNGPAASSDHSSE
ncbi:unnamed protein product [Musa hybrid cultivar]